MLALRVFSKGEVVAEHSSSEYLQSDSSLLALVKNLLHESPERRLKVDDVCKGLKEIAAKHPKEFSDVLQLYTEQCKLVQTMALIGSTEADSTELLLRCHALEQEKCQLLAVLNTLRDELAEVHELDPRSEVRHVIEHQYN